MNKPAQDDSPQSERKSGGNVPNGWCWHKVLYNNGKPSVGAPGSLTSRTYERGPMAAKHTTLTAERLREILDYDPDTGIFTNRYKRGGTTKKGSPAGHLKSNGYITIRVDGKSYYAHRLVFLWMTGEFPSGQHVDHVNGKRSDNRFSNLRDGSVSANLHNQRGSKVKGYYWARSHKKYRAQIVVDNKKIVIGAYETEGEARQAYLDYKSRENLNTKRFMTQ